MSKYMTIRYPKRGNPPRYQHKLSEQPLRRVRPRTLRTCRGARNSLVRSRTMRQVAGRRRVSASRLHIAARGATVYAQAPDPDDRPTVWDLAPDHVRDAACALAGRNLTQQEWDRSLPWAGPRRATCAQFPRA